jgi:hypothetical protein
MIIVETVWMVETRHVSTEPQMRLSEIGMCATDNFNHVTEHYPYAEIPLFVVMPNHIHAVVVIDGEKVPYKRNGTTTPRRDAARHVSTIGNDGKYCEYARMVICCYWRTEICNYEICS